MNVEEFASYDGLGLAALVQKGAMSAAELLDIAIAQVEAGNGEINAVVSRLYDQARAASFGSTQAVLGAIAFTSLFNACGNPAMSVPLGRSRNGLPIGAQFAAAFGDEATLFRLGAQIEATEPWARRRPAAPARDERDARS